MNKPQLPLALQQAVIRHLHDMLQLANHRLNSHYPEPAIRYHLRGTSAGAARLIEWEIRLNPVLLAENGERFIQEVIPHELAHLLVGRHFGRVAPHGRQWCWMMEHILNTPAHRTHQFSIGSVQGKTFVYHCSCQHHQLTVRRHNRVIRGESQYRCRQCGDLLRPVTKESFVDPHVTR